MLDCACEAGVRVKTCCAGRVSWVHAGHIQKETKDEKTGKVVPGKNVIDGDYASHGVYFLVRRHISINVNDSFAPAWI